MRVEPELRTHNKFKRLKRIVGEGAMEYVIAIWGHCQSNQRGGFWPGTDVDYVEMLCDWDGEAGLLFKALVECGAPKAGFIEVETGGLRIHDWDEMNSKTIANWGNGAKGGRPRKGENNPQETQPQTGLELGLSGSIGGSKCLKTGNPVQTHNEPNGNPVQTQCKPTLLSVSPSSLSNHSGTNKPNVNPPITQNDIGLAKQLIEVLNEATGAKFDLPLNELDAVVACLLETRGDVAGIEKMIRRQAALWKHDPKARHWLKPGTLFGANFHDYYGQRDLPVAGADRKTLEERIAKNPANRESVYHRPDATEVEKQQLRDDRSALAAA